MRFPSIASVASELRGINANVECTDDEWCDVRLQVWPDGEWAVRWGDPQYDNDHRGYWGCSSIPGVVAGKERRFNSAEVARDLIEQAKDHKAEGEV